MARKEDEKGKNLDDEIRRAYERRDRTELQQAVRRLRELQNSYPGLITFLDTPAEVAKLEVINQSDTCYIPSRLFPDPVPFIRTVFRSAGARKIVLRHMTEQLNKQFAAIINTELVTERIKDQFIEDLANFTKNQEFALYVQKVSQAEGT